MDSDTGASRPADHPALWQWVLGFIVVGLAWGFTTPFIRRGAVTSPPIDHPSLSDPKITGIRHLVLKGFFGVTDLLRRPAYSIPFLINISGSVWFFVIIGTAELSLAVPVTNSLAFLFTILGEWWVDGRVVGRDTWIGTILVLAGITLCVYSKS